MAGPPDKRSGRSPRDRHHVEIRQLASAVERLALPEQVTDYVHLRYLAYLGWLEDGATSNRLIYYGLRIPTIVIAAAVPALVTLNFGATGRAVTAGLGVVVAAGAAVEHFLGSGNRWRHYRGAAELLKGEGWLYLELAGPYSTFATHELAFEAFVRRAEEMMREEVREYVSVVVSERPPAGAPPS